MNLQLPDLLPKPWKASEADRTFWTTCYAISVGDAVNMPSGFLDTGDNQVYIILINGSLKYLSASMKHLGGREYHSNIEEESLPNGLYVLIITPYDLPDRSGDEVETKRVITETAALLAAWQGRGIIYRHVYDNIVNFSNGQRQVLTEAAENPNWWPAPRINSTSIENLKDILTKFHGLSESERERMSLALRWFRESITSTDHIDAYLRAWFVLEILAMPNTSSITPAINLFAEIYKLPYKETETKFLFQKLKRLRSDIAHHSMKPVIHGQLLRYVHAMLKDIFWHKLGLPNESNALSVLEDKSFPFEDWSPQKGSKYNGTRILDKPIR